MPKTQSRAGVGFFSNHIYKVETREKLIPEQKLWRAVLGQTLQDAFGPDLYHNRILDRKEAIAYLTDIHNDNFSIICENAGFNPVYVREKINKKLSERSI